MDSESHSEAVEELRAFLASAISCYIKQQGLSQTEAARKLGLTQPRVSDICRGKTAKFSIDFLIRILERADIYISVSTRE